MADRELLKRVAEAVYDACDAASADDVVAWGKPDLNAIIDRCIEAEAQQPEADTAKRCNDHARGVIEGLEIALSCFPKKNSTTQWYAEDEIRAEIEKRKAQKVGQ